MNENPYVGRFRRKFGGEDEMGRYVSALYDVLANTIGADGLGITAYWNAGFTNSEKPAADDLRVAHCEDTECTTVTMHAIDTAGDVGRFPSIKIGSDGLPLMSYVSDWTRDADPDTINPDLKVAHCVDVACSSATISTLDAPATVYNNIYNFREK